MTKKTLKKGIGSAITLGAMLSESTLSAAGMLQFSSSLFLWIPVFFFSGFVEGQVYWENVAEVMKSMFDPNYIKRALLRQTLQRLLDENLFENERQDNLFLQEYLRLARYIHKLQQEQHAHEHGHGHDEHSHAGHDHEEHEHDEHEYHEHNEDNHTDHDHGEHNHDHHSHADHDHEEHNHDHHSHADHDHDEHNHGNKLTLESLIESLEEMEDFFLTRCQTENRSKAYTAMEHAVDALIIKAPENFNNIELLNQQKYYWKAAGALFAAGAGTGSFFVSISVYHVGLLLAGGLIAAIPGGVLIALAAIGAIALACNLYESILELTAKYTLTQMWENIKKFFTDASWSKRLATLLVVAITVVAVIATAGTWLKLIKNGVGFFQLIDELTVYIAFSAAVIMAIPFFIYSFTNACETASQIADAFSNWWSGTDKNEKSTYEKLKLTWEKENVLQFLNPFRILTKVLSAAFFCIHLVSMAMGDNRFPEKFSSTAACTASEGVVDFPFIFGGHHHNDFSLTELSSKHHHHSGIFQNAILFVPRVLGILWELVLGNIGYLISKAHHSCSNLKTPAPTAVTWSSAKEKFFGKKHEHQVAPFQFSEEWRKQNVIEHCKQHVRSYGDITEEQVLLKEKVNLIGGLEKQLSGEKPTDAAPAPQTLTGTIDQFKSHHGETLGDHRCCFWRGATKSSKLLTKIETIANPLDFAAIPAH